MPQPDLILTPFAQDAPPSAVENIPEVRSPSDPLEKATWTQGFPGLTMIPLAAGGIPPRGQDFNGVLKAISEHTVFQGSGGQYDWNAVVAAGPGYEIGAAVKRSDGMGMWRNTVAANATDPNAGGAGWIPDGSGSTSVAMSNADVTLTALQAARSVIIITGTLTANVQLIFPAYVKAWQIINRASGNFYVTCKTAAGTGVGVPAGVSAQVVGDGTNIVSAQSLTNQSGIVKFDTAGVFTFTPTLAMQLGIIKPKVTAIGAGGAGSRNNGESGSGGGSGGAAIGIVDLTGVTSVAVTVGAGGAPAASGANGGTGGTSSFGAYISATGGGGALGTGGGGAGGTGTGGTIQVVGQGGSPRANGIGTGVFAAGAGGNSLLGGGGRGLHSAVQAQGFDGQQGGGGGGSIGSIAGGAGGAGIIVIEW